MSPLGRENIVTCVLVLCLQIHANCRIRRVYFSDRLYSEEELPAEFKLYLPVQVMINFRLDSSLNLLPRLKFLDNCVLRYW